MILLKATTFGQIKRGRTFYRKAKQFHSGADYLLRIKIGPRSAKYVGEKMCIERKIWRPSDRVYVRVRC